MCIYGYISSSVPLPSYSPTPVLTFHIFLQFSSVHQHFLLFYFFGHLCCWLLLMCHSFLASYSPTRFLTLHIFPTVQFISSAFSFCICIFSPPPLVFVILLFCPFMLGCGVQKVQKDCDHTISSPTKFNRSCPC